MIPPLKSVNIIVIRLPNWVGDIVMASPVYETLRLNFPEATIIACIRGYARGIIEHGPWFDQVIDCNDKTLAGLRRVVKDVRQLDADMALLLTNSNHSFITAKLWGIPKLYGYRRNLLRRYFLTGGPEPQKQGKDYKPLPMQEYYLELCRYLQLDIPEPPRSKLYTTPELDALCAKRLAHYGIEDDDFIIGLNPGASYGASKCWPIEYFAQLADMVQSQLKAKIILFVGPGEEEIAEAIVAASKAEIINTGPDKIGLAELKPLIKRCALLVTNDTGPRHYAVAFDVPTVVLIGPTNPEYTATNLQFTSVIRRDIPCSPCHKRICPTEHQCMIEISPEMVFAEVKSILRKKADHETGILSQKMA
jgi:heptosyltransferase-2